MIETMAVRTGENVQRGARQCNRNTSCYAAALPISSAESNEGRLGRRPSLFLFLACRVEREAAQAVRDHAFRDLNLSRVISLIHPENAASRRVAEKMRMQFRAQNRFQRIPSAGFRD
jgi:hypothetical protein